MNYYNPKLNPHGLKEEKVFENTLNKLNIKFRKPTKSEDIYEHIDYFTEDGRSFDVKVCKKLNHGKELTQEFTWIELIGNTGFPGWISGKATHIAFSIIDEYILADREELKQFIKEKVKGTELFYKPEKDIKPYVKYRRRSVNKDMIVLVPIEDIKNLKNTEIIDRYED